MAACGVGATKRGIAVAMVWSSGGGGGMDNGVSVVHFTTTLFCLSVRVGGAGKSGSWI